MAWKDGGLSGYEPRPAVPEEPGRGESSELEREGYVRAENPVMVDGQLGERMDAGVERKNPEGSVDIPLGDYQED